MGKGSVWSLRALVPWIVAAGLLGAGGSCSAEGPFLPAEGPFLPAEDWPAGDAPSAVAVADLDADGHLDLAVADQGREPDWNGGVSVLLGEGAVGFGEAIQVPAGAGPHDIAAGFLDADEAVDLVTANLLGDDVSVLLGTGDGRFEAAVAYGAGSMPHAVILEDLNGDGALDVAVANALSDDVSVLLGNGDGFLQPVGAHAAGSMPSDLAAADLDGDGIPDLAVANLTGNGVSILRGVGDGTFHPAETYPAGGWPHSISVADLDADGVPDLVTANAESGDVSVLLGRGGGLFQPPVAYPAGEAAHAVAVADLDLDGTPDVAVASFGSEPHWLGRVSVLPGNGDGTFGAPSLHDVGKWPHGLTLADLNEDGGLEAITANLQTDDVSVLLHRLAVCPDRDGDGYGAAVLLKRIRLRLSGG